MRENRQKKVRGGNRRCRERWIGVEQISARFDPARLSIFPLQAMLE